MVFFTMVKGFDTSSSLIRQLRVAASVIKVVIIVELSAVPPVAAAVITKLVSGVSSVFVFGEESSIASVNVVALVLDMSGVIFGVSASRVVSVSTVPSKSTVTLSVDSVVPFVVCSAISSAIMEGISTFTPKIPFVTWFSGSAIPSVVWSSKI